MSFRASRFSGGGTVSRAPQSHESRPSNQTYGKFAAHEANLGHAIARRRSPGDQSLYRALGKVGTVGQALDPAHISEYDAILDAPEVLRRVPATAGRLQRAEAAKAAILEGVERIEHPRVRLVMEAVLCTDPRFVGHEVKSRKALLEPDISADQYRRLRERGLRHLVGFLKGTGSHEGGDEKAPEFPASRYKREAFRLLSAAAASAFVEDMEAERRTGARQLPRLDLAAFSADGPHARCDAVTAYSVTAGPWLGRFRDTFRDVLVGRRWWSEGRANRFIRQSEAILDLGPFRVPPDDVILPDLYEGIWTPWFWEHWGGTTTLVDLATHAGVMVRESTDRFGVDQKAEVLIATESARLAGQFYPGDIRLRFDRYFHVTLSGLVKAALV